MDQEGVLMSVLGLRACLIVLWSLLAIGVGGVLLIAYRLRVRFRGP